MSPILAIASPEVNQFITRTLRAPGWEPSGTANSPEAEAHLRLVLRTAHTAPV